MKHLIPTILIILMIIGCQKEDPIVTTREVLVRDTVFVRDSLCNRDTLKTGEVYILNEGGFTKSNSSLSLFFPNIRAVISDIFYAANSRSLGDVANDIVLYKNKAYIVVNNSHKIEIISTDTHLSLGSVSVPGNSPNKIVIVNDTKGYISNLYKGTVTSFNPTTFAIIKDNIHVGLNPQSMAYVNGRVLVCNSGYGSDSTVSVIDPLKDSVVATITVAKSPSEIAIDGDGDIIVLSNGYSDFSNPSNDTHGAITVINPISLAITSTIPFPLNSFGHPFELAVSKKGYGFTITKNGIAKFDTKLNSITHSVFIPRNPYSISVDDVTERIYLGDARDYNSNGRLLIYEKNATLADSVTVGIIPGTIIFKR